MIRSILKFFPSSINKIFSLSKIKILLTSLSLVFISSSIFNNSAQIFSQSLDEIALLLLFISLLITCLSIVVNGLAWSYLIQSFGFNIIDLNLTELFIRTNIFKYLPGGFWHFIERFSLLKSKITLSSSITAILLEPLMMIAAASLWMLFGDFSLIFKTISILPLILLHPSFRKLLISYFGRLTYSKLNRKIPIDLSIESIIAEVSNLNIFPFKAIFTEFAFVFLRFIGFWICLKIFSIHNNLYLFDWLSIFCLSWIIGLVIPAAPGGVGVFESVVLLLTANLNIEAKVISSILCYRAISTLSDLITYLFVRYKYFLKNLVQKS